MINRQLKKQHAGIGLIEVLISILVISVGVMGLIGTQITAKRATNDAVQRSIASGLAQDIIERMRTNGTQLASYMTTGDGLGGGSLASGGKECTSSITICTPTELASYDLYHWETMLDGAGEIRSTASVGGLMTPTACVESDADGVITVSVAWRGMSPLTNPTSTDCGEGLSRYGDSDEYRQVITLTTYVSSS